MMIQQRKSENAIRHNRKQNGINNLYKSTDFNNDDNDSFIQHQLREIRDPQTALGSGIISY